MSRFWRLDGSYYSNFDPKILIGAWSEGLAPGASVVIPAGRDLASRPCVHRKPWNSMSLYGSEHPIRDDYISNRSKKYGRSIGIWLYILPKASKRQ